MSAHRNQLPVTRRGLRWVAGFTGAGVLAASAFLVAGPADASAATVSAQLSLTGIATQSSPLGGSVVGIHPGDSVVFSAATVPTTALNLKSLGIGDLVNGLLPYSVTLDASGLPGGVKGEVLNSSSAYKLTFPTAGTYSLNWMARDLLGAINLNGNELQAAGIAFNASTGWSAKIVVAADPPSGGLAIQLPSIAVAPSVPVVGQLPTVQVPGVTTPTLPVVIPTSISGIVGSGTGGGDGGTGGSGATPGSSNSGSSTPSYSLPGLTVPDLVVPKGDGSLSGGGAGLGELTSVFGSFNAVPLTVPTPTSSTDAGPVPADTSPAGSAVSTKQVVDLAATKAPTAQMPVLLAILAILALSLVTATYARLYLLRREV